MCSVDAEGNEEHGKTKRRRVKNESILRVFPDTVSMPPFLGHILFLLFT